MIGGAGGYNCSIYQGVASDCDTNDIDEEGEEQGSFTPHLQLLTRNHFTPGAGGSGRSTRHLYRPEVGGSGGVLLNGNGPNAPAGSDPIAGGFGGSGFGADCGAGGSWLNKLYWDRDDWHYITPEAKELMGLYTLNGDQVTVEIATLCTRLSN